VVVATRQEVFWRRLCNVIEHPGLANNPRFATNADRVENRRELIPLLEDIFRTQTTAHWLTQLRKAEVPVAPVNNLDSAFAEPPVTEREMIVEYEHPDVGTVRLPGNPIKMSDMAGTISHPAPRLGEHTDALLAGLLKLSAGEIADLRQQGAIA
jgi:crotonobetainyl-CoA:carnitine CoA-transferase CaiB-like acyl-CoA transferase